MLGNPQGVGAPLPPSRRSGLPRNGADWDRGGVQTDGRRVWPGSQTPRPRGMKLVLGQWCGRGWGRGLQEAGVARDHVTREARLGVGAARGQGAGPGRRLTPLSMVCVWHSVPSAAGMLLVMHRLLLLRHHSSLQTSCGRDARSSSPSSRGDPGSLPAGQWGPGSQGIFSDTVAGFGLGPPRCLHTHCTY